jgi:hypothetical protein
MQFRLHYTFYGGPPPGGYAYWVDPDTWYWVEGDGEEGADDDPSTPDDDRNIGEMPSGPEGGGGTHNLSNWDARGYLVVFTDDRGATLQAVYIPPAQSPLVPASVVAQLALETYGDEIWRDTYLADEGGNPTGPSLAHELVWSRGVPPQPVVDLTPPIVGDDQVAFQNQVGFDPTGPDADARWSAILDGMRGLSLSLGGLKQELDGMNINIAQGSLYGLRGALEGLGVDIGPVIGGGGASVSDMADAFALAQESTLSAYNDALNAAGEEMLGSMDDYLASDAADLADFRGQLESDADSAESALVDKLLGAFAPTLPAIGSVESYDIELGSFAGHVLPPLRMSSAGWCHEVRALLLLALHIAVGIKSVAMVVHAS